MQVTVELRPHIGLQNTALGTCEVEHDQWMVFGRSDQVPQLIFLGYIGKREGSPFNGYTTYRDLPSAVKEEIVRQVAQLAGWTTKAFEPSTSPVDEQVDDATEDEE